MKAGEALESIRKGVREVSTSLSTTKWINEPAVSEKADGQMRSAGRIDPLNRRAYEAVSGHCSSKN